MKIIEKIEWKYEFTCLGCKSKLEAEAGDVKCGSFGGGYSESGDTGYYVSCVVCGTDLILSGYGDAKPRVAVFIPENIKTAALNKHRSNS